MCTGYFLLNTVTFTLHKEAEDISIREVFSNTFLL